MNIKEGFVTFLVVLALITAIMSAKSCTDELERNRKEGEHHACFFRLTNAQLSPKDGRRACNLLYPLPKEAKKP